MKICLDPGHMGKINGMDCGAVGCGLYESDITLQVAEKVKSILQSNGVDVVLTRESERQNSLQEKCDTANNFGADYFISIHCNSADDASAKGTETFSYSESGKGRELAGKIQPLLVQAIGTVNRGLKTANFYVLKNTHMPAVLVELAFISNQGDANKLSNNQNEIASAIAKGILSQIGVSYTNTVKNSTGGSTMNYVLEIQKFINNLGICDKLTEDGLIGPKTKNAIKILLEKVNY